MKGSSRVLWVALAVVAVVVVLLVDPLGWTVDGGEEARPTVAAVDTAESTEALRELEGVDDTPAAEGVAPSERQAAESQVAVLRVLDWNGAPVADAQLLLVRGAELFCDRRTGEEGTIEVEADGEAAGVAIAVTHRPIEWREVELSAGTHDLRLAKGARLGMRFVTEGGEPAGRVRLGIDSDHAPTEAEPLPAVVEEALEVPTVGEAYVVLDSDEEGGLELTGLSPEWSGRIQIRPRWKVESTTHGTIEPRQRGIRIATPAPDIVVTLVLRPTLRGRLVLQDDGSPVGNVRLSALLNDHDSSSLRTTSTRTDAEGRFEIVHEVDSLAELDLRLGSDFDGGAPLLHLLAPALPADGDLGDILVSAVRHVPFLLVDSQSEPIPRGVAVAAGTRSDRTGRDGRSVLRWIPRVADELTAEADGFVPTTCAIPPVVVEPLVVRMERATGLVVRLLLPEGANPTQFKVLLRGDERITAAPLSSSSDQRRHVSQKAIHILDFTGEDPERYLCSQVDGDTSSTSFQALRTGIEIDLEVHGITGRVVYHTEALRPLAPAEQRELEVSLETGMIVFRGRVVDEEGTPLAHATAQLGNQILGRTRDDGCFEAFFPESRTGTLLLKHPTCTTQYLHDWTVPTDGKRVEFRLEPSRPLTIEVVDERGTPMPLAVIYTEYGGFTSNTHRIEGHRFLVRSMPAGTFVIRTHLAGKIYSQDHDPPASEARVVVPVHGRAAAVVDAGSIAQRAGKVVLVLIPEEDDLGVVASRSRGVAPDLRLEIPAALPGDYGAVLRYLPTEEERAAGRAEVESDPVTITVRPDALTEVRLALPPDGG